MSLLSGPPQATGPSVEQIVAVRDPGVSTVGDVSESKVPVVTVYPSAISSPSLSGQRWTLTSWLIASSGSRSGFCPRSHQTPWWKSAGMTFSVAVHE